MISGDAGRRDEKPAANPEGRDRKSREYGIGASRIAANRGRSGTEAKARLMELVVSRETMMAAHRRVLSNKGSAGVDDMPVDDLLPYLREHWAAIKEELLHGRYEPSPVRGVEIPEPGGKGVRLLSIPTVLDRLIQQALHQVLMPIFDPGFSGSPYGFRPGRSAHQAVLAARAQVASGRRWVVDMDLEKFFDRVNHDVLMARLGRKVVDKRVLGLIGRYLRAGLMARATLPWTSGTSSSPCQSGTLLRRHVAGFYSAVDKCGRDFLSLLVKILEAVLQLLCHDYETNRQCHSQSGHERVRHRELALYLH